MTFLLLRPFSRGLPLLRPRKLLRRKSFPSRFPSIPMRPAANKIEGEVLLEVTFEATGKLHVLRVVRGLGHGLDDAAVRAAGTDSLQACIKGRSAIGLDRRLTHYFSASVIFSLKVLMRMFGLGLALVLTFLTGVFPVVAQDAPSSPAAQPALNSSTAPSATPSTTPVDQPAKAAPAPPSGTTLERCS